jgi:ParB family chromosome partitioning protein
MSQTIEKLATSDIRPGDNDRHTFAQKPLQELADSIHANGLAQPITVRPVYVCYSCGHVVAKLGDTLDDTPHECPKCTNVSWHPLYEIVAGERRFRACTELLKWQEIPAIVRQLDDEEASNIMLAENLNREDLDPIDEAHAYKKRIDEFGWSIAETARRASVSESRIRNRLALLDLVPEAQHLISHGNLPLGFGVEISKLDNNRQRIALSWLRDQAGTPTRRAIKVVVNKLYEEQQQEALFDLDSLFVAQVEDIVEDKGTRMGDILPRLAGMPEADTSAASMGRLFDQYLTALLDQGHTEAAGVIADFWAKALDGNWARLSPYNSEVLRKHPEFVLKR